MHIFQWELISMVAFLQQLKHIRLLGIYKEREPSYVIQDLLIEKNWEDDDEQMFYSNLRYQTITQGTQRKK